MRISLKSTKRQIRGANAEPANKTNRYKNSQNGREMRARAKRITCISFSKEKQKTPQKKCDINLRFRTYGFYLLLAFNFICSRLCASPRPPVYFGPTCGVDSSNLQLWT